MKTEYEVFNVVYSFPFCLPRRQSTFTKSEKPQVDKSVGGPKKRYIFI